MVDIKRTRFRNRPGWALDNDHLRLVLLDGGGHLASLALATHGKTNPLWAPPWTPIEPTAFRPRDKARHGSQLLAAIAGHNLCLGCFGGPSPEEAAAGGPGGHGEAPVVRWRATRRRVTARGLEFQFGCEMPIAQLRCVRTVEMAKGAAFIRVRDVVENVSRRDLPYTMCQHVTFGPPFLEPGVTLFDASATRGHTFPDRFSGRQRLKADTAFTWPEGPGARGGTVDLRTLGKRPSSDFSTQLMDPRRELAWFSAVNPRLGLLVAYAWNRADYPWLGNWEEHHARPEAPWNGKTLSRGMEFTNTPFPEGLRKAVDRGRFQGERTFRWVPARGRVTSEFVILMTAVEAGTRGVRDLRLDAGVPCVALDG